MKFLRSVGVVLCVLALAAWAYGGTWYFSAGSYTGHHSYHGSHGPVAYPRHVTKVYTGWGSPYYPVYPSSTWYVPVSSEDWGYTWYGVSYPGYAWGPWYPYGWGWGPRIYRRTVVYPTVVYPVVGGTVTRTTVISGSRGTFESGGVYVVPPEPVAEDVSVVMPLPSPIRTIESPAAGDLARISGTLRRGDAARAEGDLQKLLLKHPSDAQVHCVYAYVLFLREKYTAGSFVLRRALVLDGRLVQAGRLVLEGYYGGEEAARGLAKLDEHMGADASDSAARLLRAYLRFLAGERESARADLDLILNENADDGQAALLRQSCASGDEAPR